LGGRSDVRTEKALQDCINKLHFIHLFMQTSTEKYDIIGKGYNTTRKADAFMAQRFFEYLSPAKNGSVLDVGCGTGNYAIALHEKGLHITGIDPSAEMLNMAKSKTNKINWHSGKAEQLQFNNQTFDGALACLTIHHWKNLTEGLTELGRVLKTGSPLVIFTSTPQQMEGYWLNHYFPKMLTASIVPMPSYENIESNLNQAGFKITATENYFIREGHEDLFLQAGKHRPEIYLDPNVQKGISSFASFSNTEEKQRGLQQLSEDIKTGKIKQVIADYENTLGDYMFIVAQKM
jgi:ubiquinone/menaquinone biosynthesis C-methylase UbiE